MYRKAWYISKRMEKMANLQENEEYVHRVCQYLGLRMFGNGKQPFSARKFVAPAGYPQKCTEVSQFFP